jgi:hypothetical protein
MEESCEPLIRTTHLSAFPRWGTMHAVDAGVGDILPVLVVAAVLTLARHTVRRRPFSYRLLHPTPSAARGGGPRSRRASGVKPDPLLDILLVALAVAYMGFVADLLIKLT